MAAKGRIKDQWREQRLFEQRAIVAGVVILLLTGALLARLAWHAWPGEEPPLATGMLCVLKLTELVTEQRVATGMLCRCCAGCAA